ncbi:medium chain dehydrogenase/reductase family protein [Coraliomargarita algicola]|uniref:Medium chain dehydrogenase/reductase family protein n=1 Tax=Coraliomargarita algicola TaxID=3092156 RepID=A0ABZ0RK83_9BACT|nr:medium chain dehydrogenase/reductase family protein [Coraliomargarita sp. J2-16]WPJ95571.1 medium chain dehydrogenase/reductase family protein [Coraliomargarita sp. J2-16]
MTTEVNAIVFDAINKVSVQSFPFLTCGATEIVCETLYTFVSPGTELRVLGGHYSKAEDFPLIPGYSSVGRVVEVGASVRGYQLGDLVSCRNPNPLEGVNAMWGGQAGRQVHATAGEQRPVLLPAGCDALDYVVAEVASISLRGVVAAQAKRDETAVVIGQGMIGAFSAAWLMAEGCRVIVCDVDEARLEQARQRGVFAAVNLRDDNSMERLNTLLHDGADIVVESSGVSAGVETAFKLVRKKPQAYGEAYKIEPIQFYGGDWSRLVLQANYIEPVSINPHGFFPGEGVTILTPMDRGVEERYKCIESIRTGRLKAQDYIDLVMPYRDAAEGYRKLQSHELSSVVFAWQ